MSFSTLRGINEMMKGDAKEWDDQSKELDIFNALKFF